MRRSRSIRGRRRRGAAVLELALILPVLVTIVLGCVDFGRFAYSYIAVTNAARAGAGFASYNPYTASTQPLWEQKTREAALAELGDAFDHELVTIPSPVVIEEPDDFRRVRVEVQYRFETIVSWPLLPTSMTLRRDAEMRFIR